MLLQDGDSLLDFQVVDSTGFLELIHFVEAEFGLKVADAEMVLENFESIDRIAQFVQRKRGACRANKSMAHLPELGLAHEAARIAARLREITEQTLRRRGLVVAISGGIDSSVCAALAVRALGEERVFGLLLPERDSSGASTRLGRLLVEHLGVRHELQDISTTLDMTRPPSGYGAPTARRRR